VLVKIVNTSIVFFLLKNKLVKRVIINRHARFLIHYLRYFPFVFFTVCIPKAFLFFYLVLRCLLFVVDNYQLFKLIEALSRNDVYEILFYSLMIDLNNTKFFKILLSRFRHSLKMSTNFFLFHGYLFIQSKNINEKKKFFRFHFSS